MSLASSTHDLLVVGGGIETPGAVLLSAIAALRTGAGKLAIAVPESIALPLALRIPEARVMIGKVNAAFTERNHPALVELLGRRVSDDFDKGESVKFVINPNGLIKS